MAALEPSCLDGAQFHSWQKKENLFLQLLRLSAANLQSHLPVLGDSWDGGVGGCPVW